MQSFVPVFRYSCSWISPVESVRRLCSSICLVKVLAIVLRSECRPRGENEFLFESLSCWIIAILWNAAGVDWCILSLRFLARFSCCAVICLAMSSGWYSTFWFFGLGCGVAKHLFALVHSKKDISVVLGFGEISLFYPKRSQSQLCLAQRMFALMGCICLCITLCVWLAVEDEHQPLADLVKFAFFAAEIEAHL